MLYKRLAQTDDAPVRALFTAVTALLHERLAPYADRTLAPFATEVVALDETTLDPVARRLPVLHGVPRGDDRLLPGKLAGVFDLRRQLWRQVQYLARRRARTRRSPRAGWWPTLPAGEPGAGRSRLFRLRLVRRPHRAGLPWVSAACARRPATRCSTLPRPGRRDLDALVWLGKYRADRATHAVRLVQFRRGDTLVSLPDQRDPTLACRWRRSRGSMPAAGTSRWRSTWSRPTRLAICSGRRNGGAILHQIWAVLTIAQLLQALRVEIAGQAGVAVDNVSMALLVAYLPQFVARGQDGVAASSHPLIRALFVALFGPWLGSFFPL